MFTSIVVALDLEATGDRALPFAASLAALSGLPVELVTVASPRMPKAVDLDELDQRASAHRLDDSSCVVLHDDDAGSALVEPVAARPKGPVAPRAFSAH